MSEGRREGGREGGREGERERGESVSTTPITHILSYPSECAISTASTHSTSTPTNLRTQTH